MIEPRATTSIADTIVLNQVQKEAVLYDVGPQLVFAGAGSGKTRVLTAKIAFLIRDKGLAPHTIFAATFTNKAAREMAERIESFTGIPCKGLWIGTFHSLCVRILRQEAHHLGYTRSFTIFDRDDQTKCINRILKELGIDERTLPPKQAIGAISHYKNRCMTPEDADGTTSRLYEKEVVRVYRAYQASLLKLQAMDFDDLLTNVVYLFRKNPLVLAGYQNLFKYILVDEYQDTNLTQFYLVKYLAEAHQALFVVGDDDQSIYGWRGAHIDNILSFASHFPNTKTFKLEENYRSTQPILSMANAVISQNSKRVEKNLFSQRQSKSAVILSRFRDDRQESEHIATTIAEQIKAGISPGDICVLFRTNAQSRLFEDTLRKQKIPYILVGGMSFYDRKEIKDCIAYLRLLSNPADDISFERIMNVPARGLGDKALETLLVCATEKRQSLLACVLSGEPEKTGGRSAKGFAQLKELFTSLVASFEKNVSPKTLLEELLTLSGYTEMLEGEDSEDAESRLDNLNELLRTITFWCNDNPDIPLDTFLEEISLVSDIDTWEQKDSAVNLMTMHCAKGLEFKTVFLVGIEDGILPSKLNFEDEDKMEEERRLLYVGITRSIDTLRISYCEQRWRFGTVVPMDMSRFLMSIDAGLYHQNDHTSRAQFSFSFIDDEKKQPAAKGAYTQNYQRDTTYRSSNQTTARSTTPPPRPSKDDFDEFNQDIVSYRMGQYVSHKLYGKGKIVAISGIGKEMRLTVLFNNGERKKLIAAFANLTCL